MILSIDENLIPRVFMTIEGYKYWVMNRLRKGHHPDV